MNRLARLLPIALLAALPSCGDEPEDAAADSGRSAAGEVLEGSISDEMLPYDRLRSQPPLAEVVENDAGDAEDGRGVAPAADAAATAAAAAPPEDAPEEEPEEPAAPAAADD